MKPIGVLGELDRKRWPRTYRGEHTREIRFPLGGIGTGTISLGGRGQLRDWEIFNRPAKGNDLPSCFCLLRTETADGSVCARVLEGRIPPPFEAGHGLPLDRLSGIPRLRNCTFTGAYPFAYVTFADPDVPVQVTLEAFNPLVPGDPDVSGIPAAILRYHVHNPGRKPVKVSLAFSAPNPVGKKEDRRNEPRRSGRLRGVQCGNAALPPQDPANGTFCLAVDGPRAAAFPCWPADYPHDSLNIQTFWRHFKAKGRPPAPEDKEDHGKTAVCASMTVAPRATEKATFYLTWHFPNRTPSADSWHACECSKNAVIGNYYATQFKDAWDVAEQLSRRLPGLEADSRAFVKSLLGSSLPPVAIEAALSNASTLRTATCFRPAEGSFYGFEGCNDQSGCCFGSCTHVWNYEQTSAFLFPSLARSMRETEFLVSTDESGFMCFRTMLPPGEGKWHFAAADGQMGCIMKLCRDWKLCGDTEWLRRLWPRARKALEFCWQKGGWDADRDGVMEGAQHTTYDSELYGPNPLCEVWYLGALRAAEEMARALGEAEFADHVRGLFEKGSRWTDEHLFNGEYYEQQVQPAALGDVADGLRLDWPAIDPLQPRSQIEDGCLVDQLLGQYFAHVVGLGYLLKPENVKRTALSIFRNNRVSMAEHECVGRSFALNDEKGLVVCSWPKGKKDRMVHWLFSEFWTGLEYQAAALMVYEGRIREGLRVIADVRERHDGRKRNPWNEPECGHHYARAMSAWATLLALSGFQYSAPDAEMQVLPRVRKNPFRCFWSTGTAWGTVAIDTRRRRAELRVLHGKLTLRTLRLPAALAGVRTVKLGERAVRFRPERDGQAAAVRLSRALSLSPGKALTLG